MDLHIDSFAHVFLGDGAYLETVADAVVKPSPVAGRGLCSTRARAPGEILAVLDGQVVAWAAFPKVLDLLEWNALDPEHLLVRPLRTSYGLINHSPRPNVEISADGRIMRVTPAVAAGEEFTMDYFAQPVPEVYLQSAEARRLNEK